VSHPALFKEIEVAVVAALPLGKEVSIPPMLPHRYLRDENDIIATALNVRMVPFVAFLDERGVVERVKVGQSSISQIVGWLESLEKRRK
jgi:hypothetical protein